MAASDHTPKIEVIGVIPAAGHATRIAPLPCSKELYPIGFHVERSDQRKRPKAVSHYLLEKMQVAGIQKAYFVLRSGKWDIPTYFGSGSMVNMNLAYLALDSSWGVPCTLDHAYPFVRHATVAFGFPDILFSSRDAFLTLLNLQEETKADVVLGLCPKRKDAKTDAVVINDGGVVQNLIVGTMFDEHRYSWAIAVWNSVFTEYLHNYVERHGSADGNGPELSAGHAIKSALDSNMRVHAAVISEEPYLDIGTPEDLATATRRGLDGHV